MKPEHLYLQLADAIRTADRNPPCQETDPEAWFLDKSDIAVSTQAKKLCDSCPVIAQCGAYAVAAHEQFGIWGGMTPRERSFLRTKGRRGVKPGGHRDRLNKVI